MTNETLEQTALRIWSEVYERGPMDRSIKDTMLEFARRLLAEQPICDCGDSFASDSQCINCIAAAGKSCAEQPRGEPVAWAVWVEVAGFPGFDSIWERPEFANDHLNDMLQQDWGEPIKSSGVVAMACIQDDKYPIPEWLRARIQKGLRESSAHPAAPVSAPSLTWEGEPITPSQRAVAAPVESAAGTPRTMEQLRDEVQDYTRWQLIQRMGQAERDRNTAELDLAAKDAELSTLRKGMEGKVLVPIELINRLPELNPLNFNADEVTALNDWGIAVWQAANPVLSAAKGEGK